MVVTCEYGNFKLPHSNFCEIFLFLLFGENFSFRKKIFRENFHKKIFIFLCENFLFFSVSVSVSVISLLYIFSTLAKQ